MCCAKLWAPEYQWPSNAASASSNANCHSPFSVIQSERSNCGSGYSGRGSTAGVAGGQQMKAQHKTNPITHLVITAGILLQADWFVCLVEDLDDVGDPHAFLSPLPHT